MNTQIDKTTQVLKQMFDALAERETASNKRDVRQMRRRIKHAIHKRERNLGKRELTKQLVLDID